MSYDTGGCAWSSDTGGRPGLLRWFKSHRLVSWSLPRLATRLTTHGPCRIHTQRFEIHSSATSPGLPCTSPANGDSICCVCISPATRRPRPTGVKTLERSFCSGWPSEPNSEWSFRCERRRFRVHRIATSRGLRRKSLATRRAARAPLLLQIHGLAATSGLPRASLPSPKPIRCRVGVRTHTRVFQIHWLATGQCWPRFKPRLAASLTARPPSGIAAPITAAETPPGIAPKPTRSVRTRLAALGPGRSAIGVIGFHSRLVQIHGIATQRFPRLGTSRANPNPTRSPIGATRGQACCHRSRLLTRSENRTHTSKGTRRSIRPSLRRSVHEAIRSVHSPIHSSIHRAIHRATRKPDDGSTHGSIHRAIRSTNRCRLWTPTSCVGEGHGCNGKRRDYAGKWCVGGSAVPAPVLRGGRSRLSTQSISGGERRVGARKGGGPARMLA